MRWCPLVIAGLICCGPAVEVEDDAQATDNATTADPGERPAGPSQMYAACDSVDQCAPLEFCVFPTREGGYCAGACGPGEDVSPCDSAPGTGAVVSCLDISIPDGRTVCALDCSDGACPAGMQCEAVDSPTGARRICF